MSDIRGQHIPVRKVIEGISSIEAISMQRVMKPLSSFTRLSILDAFARMGGFEDPGSRGDQTVLMDQMGVKPGFTGLMERMMQMLNQAGLIHGGEGSRWQIHPPGIAGALDQLESEKRELLTTGGVRHLMPLLTSCLDEYPDILTGKKHPLSVLFPKGSFSLVNPFFRDNPYVDYFNRVVATIISNQIAAWLERSPGARINILEIGAGTGGTSRFVLDAVKAYGDHLTYYYTDVSGGFTASAKEEFGASSPFARFQILDIENIGEGGLQPGQMDIVFGTNVFHATRRISRSLDHARNLLKEGGMFLLSENVKDLDYVAAIFGLLPGWWAFEDPEYRLPYSPLIRLDTWRALFGTAGFQKTQVLGLPDTREEQMEQCILVAEKGLS